MREDLQDVPRQSNIEIKFQEVKTQLKKIPNWKAPDLIWCRAFGLRTFPAYIAELQNNVRNVIKDVNIVHRGVR